MSDTATTAESADRWWAVVNGKAAGPHPKEAILKALREGKLSIEDYVCPVGEQTWKAVREWPQFARVVPPPPPASAERASQAPWWVTVNHQPVGPLNHADVVARVHAGEFGAATVACQVGKQQWTALAALPEFSWLFPANTHRTMIGPAADSSRLLTNAALPVMANCICLYCLLASPIMLVLGWIDALASSSTFHDQSIFRLIEFLANFAYEVIGLAATVFLLIGGLHLRRLQRSAPSLVITGLVVDLVNGVLAICFWFGINFLATASGGDHFRPTANEPDAGTLFSLVLLPFCLAFFVFEINALIWMIRNRKSLPLVGD